MILDLFVSIPLYYTFFCPSILGRRHVEGGFGYLTFRSGLEKKELINCLMNLKIDQNNPDMVLAKDAAPKKDKYDYMVPGNLLRSAYLYNQVDVKSANNILNNLVW